MTPQYLRLYYAAQRADDAYQRALSLQYGARAQDMRYRTAEQTHAIQALGTMKRAADDAMLACTRAMRAQDSGIQEPAQ